MAARGRPGAAGGRRRAAAGPHRAVPRRHPRSRGRPPQVRVRVGGEPRAAYSDDVGEGLPVAAPGGRRRLARALGPRAARDRPPERRPPHPTGERSARPLAPGGRAHGATARAGGARGCDRVQRRNGGGVREPAGSHDHHVPARRGVEHPRCARPGGAGDRQPPVECHQVLLPRRPRRGSVVARRRRHRDGGGGPGPGNPSRQATDDLRAVPAARQLQHQGAWGGGPRVDDQPGHRRGAGGKALG